MGILNNKIDFAVLVNVTNANPNGDPLNGNRPRTDYDGFGEISDVCIKRKIRNRMQDMAYPIFVQSEDRATDNFSSLSERASEVISSNAEGRDQYSKLACETWLDVRSFGQVFAFKSKDKNGVSINIRGPVSIHLATSVFPVDIAEMQITKSVNSEPSETRSSDTMGKKFFVRHGLYVIKGSINVQLAEKSGFSEEDADIIKECLRTLFENDSSAARPDGSMEVVKVYWWKHNCASGQYSSAKVHNSLNIQLKDGVLQPRSIADYVISLNNLEGLEPKIIAGI